MAFPGHHPYFTTRKLIVLTSAWNVLEMLLKAKKDTCVIQSLIKPPASPITARHTDAAAETLARSRDRNGCLPWIATPRMRNRWSTPFDRDDRMSWRRRRRRQRRCGRFGRFGLVAACRDSRFRPNVRDDGARWGPLKSKRLAIG